MASKLYCWQVFVGYDGAYLQALQAGLDGNVSSGGGAVLVDTFQSIHAAYDNGDSAAAEQGQCRMDAW
jgi:dihydrodipicolinate synthase/N-acetylneuraminate lyase